MSILSCPVCKNDLTAEPKRYVCANNHSFDIAKQGYVNLLLSSQMASKHPGDSAEMLADRHAFLEAGFYQSLRNRIVELIAKSQATQIDEQTVLDLGCGEGYYTIAMTAPKRNVYALDIAKPALTTAAKRSKEIIWCVGTSRALPFHDNTLDVITNIFCRPHLSEIQRVLRDNGVLLTAGPGPNHLRELRELLYETVKTETVQHELSGFVLVDSEILSYEFTVDRGHLMQLARMTPHYWRAPQSRRDRLENIEELTLHAEFIVQRFRKHPPLASLSLTL